MARPRPCTASMERVAEFLGDQYEGKIVTRTEDYCPQCLKGSYSQRVVMMSKKASERREFWMSEFEEKRLDPFAVLCNFVPKQVGGNMIASYAHFTRNLLNLSKPGKRCAEGRNCDPTCIFCNCIIPETQEPKITTVSDPPFHVHPGCLTQCSYVAPGSGARSKVQCKKMIPCIPVHFRDFQGKGMCREHTEIARKEAERQLFGLDFVAPVVQPVSRGKKAMDFAPPDDSPGQYPKVFVPPDREPHKAAKTAAKPKSNSKLERLGESKYSHDIRGMFFSKPVKESSNGTSSKASKNPKKQGYERPEVVFTPHSKPDKKAGKRKRVVSSDED